MNGPASGLLAPLTVPASWLYRMAVAARNARFDRGNGVASVGVPVISVGNVTAGGAGKTPMVAWIAGKLLAKGHRPLVALRGYKAKGGEPADEDMEHRERLAGVEVVADPDRRRALRAALPRNPEVDCVLLDDGFQHRRLGRNLDLVLIDATRNTMSDRLLPRGWLREPLGSLRRADAVAITRAAAVDDELAVEVQRHHGRPPVAWSRHIWAHLGVFDPDERTVDCQWLRGKRVVTLLGVGNPSSILDQVERAGASIAVDVPARDHERYGGSKMTLTRHLCENADALVLTNKDWVKVRRLIDVSSWPVPIVVPRLEIDVFQGAGALEDLVDRTVAGEAAEL